MKPTHTTLLRLLMAVLLMGVGYTAGADTKPEGDFIYTTVNGAKLKFQIVSANNKIVEVYGFTSDANFQGELHIPASFMYDGDRYYVGSITEGSFKNEYGITGLVIDEVSIIDKEAFAHCYNLAYVKILASSNGHGMYSVSYLHDYAFSGCYALTSMEVPSIWWPGDETKALLGVFSNLPNLESITVPDANLNVGGYFSEDGVLFLKHRSGVNAGKTSLWTYPRGKKDSAYSIPSYINGINPGAFYTCSKLNTVTIPDGIKSIGAQTFEDCDNLQTVNLPQSLTYIGQCAFAFCDRLNNIDLPNSITEIGPQAFVECDALTTVKLPYYLEKIGSQAFDYCSMITKVVAKNPSAPVCADDAFRWNERYIDLIVPVGSDYAQWDPWKRMKSITESDNILEKYGIRVLGNEVTELNYDDVMKNGGGIRYSPKWDMLFLKNLDITCSNNMKFIENYGVDDLTIDVEGTCSIKAPSGYPFYFQKATSITGDTLTISGAYGVSSIAPVTLMNDVYFAEASSMMFFTPSLAIDRATSFIGALGESATAGWIGELYLGTGCGLVGWEDGHDLTYDSTQGTILDNGAAMAGGSIFTIGEPFPIYYNNIHLSSATNYLLGSLFRGTHNADGTYTLKGLLSGMANGYPLLKTTASGVILDVQDYSYVSVQGEGVPAFQFGGDVTICGTGPLTVISHYGAGIYISSGTLTFKDLDIDIQGKTVGIYSKRVSKYFQGDLVFDNVAGTIKSNSDGSPSINLINSVTLDNCYFVNGSFNDSTHKVEAQEVELRRGIHYTTAIDSVSTTQDINGTFYDLQGRRVTTPQPGQIYIVRDAKGNTHKVVAK